MPVILGKNGVNKELSSIYIGNSGINKQEKELYIGKGGINKQIYTSELFRVPSLTIRTEYPAANDYPEYISLGSGIQSNTVEFTATISNVHNTTSFGRALRLVLSLDNTNTRFIIVEFYSQIRYVGNGEDREEINRAYIEAFYSESIYHSKLSSIGNKNIGIHTNIVGTYHIKLESVNNTDFNFYINNVLINTFKYSGIFSKPIYYSYSSYLNNTLYSEMPSGINNLVFK